MNNTVFLHVGYPKTATTFLQQEYFPAIDQLYYIPQVELWKSGFLTILFDSYLIDRQSVYNSILKNWKSKAGSKPLFISYEGFIGNLFSGAQNIELISKRLKATGFDFKVLLTIRKQDAVINSLYNQYIHQGGSINFDNFIRLTPKEPLHFSLELFNYYRMYEVLTLFYGQDNIHIIPYEALKKGVFLDYLSQYFETELSLGKSNFNNQNVSVNGFRFTLLRFLNRFLSSWVSPNGIVPASLINSRSVKGILQSNKKLGSSPNYFMNNSTCLEYQKEYSDSNRMLEEKINISLKADFNYF